MRKRSLLILFVVISVFSVQSVRGESWQELLNEVDSLFEVRNYDSAVATCEVALRTAEEELGAEDTTIARILCGLGLYCIYAADYDKAEMMCKRAATIQEKLLGPEHPNVAGSYECCGIACWDLSRYAEAESYLKKALAITEAWFGSVHPFVADKLSYLAQFMWEMGRYDEAEQLFLRTVNISEKVFEPNHPFLAMVLFNLASLIHSQGDYAGAELLYERALRIDEEAHGFVHQDRDIAVRLRGLADLYLEIGRYAEAEELSKRAVAIFTELFGPDHKSITSSLNNLASCYIYQGNYSDAEHAYRRALDIDRKALGQKHPEVAVYLNNLASLSLHQGNLAEAESLYTEALTIREEIFRYEHPDIALTLIGLGDLRTEQGRYDEADTLYAKALSIQEKSLGVGHDKVSLCLESISRLNRLQARHAAAVRFAGRCCMIRLGNFADNSVAMSEKDALTYSQSIRSAVSNYLTCYSELETPNDSTTSATASIVLANKGQVSDGVFERQEAIVKETDSTTLALAESLRFTKFELSKLFVRGPGENMEVYRSKTDSLSKLANKLETDLSRRSASYRRQQDYKDVSADRIISLLPEGAALVEYMSYNHLQLQPSSALPRYLAVVLMKGDEPLIIDLGDASEIDAVASQYRTHMLQVSTAARVPAVAEQAYKQISERLYASVWQPIEEIVDDKDLVLIAPDGALNTVSFAGLTDPDGNYLIEKHAIHYLSAGRDLIRLQDEPEPASGLFALGDPDYNASASSRLLESAARVDTAQPSSYYAHRNVRSICQGLQDIKVNSLLGTRREIELIAANWKQKTDELCAVCFGSDASEERFKAKAPGCRIVHLATHGYYAGSECIRASPKGRIRSDIGFVGENPLLVSGLLFAGANLHGAGADSAGVEDGILTAYEVSALDLSGTDLVVLSACETGLGEVKDNEGVYGLRRAFQMAGARTVVSALWPVSDRLTAEIMSKLYAGTTDESLPETIRSVQIERINELRLQGEADHPYSWGAFIAIGDWR